MIIPVGHRVLIEQEDFQEADEVYKSAKRMGLEIVHDKNVRAQESVDTGVVKAIGPTAWQSPDLGGIPWCKVGDKVVFAKFAGKKVEDPENKDAHLTLINDEDICAILRG